MDMGSNLINRSNPSTSLGRMNENRRLHKWKLCMSLSPDSQGCPARRIPPMLKYTYVSNPGLTSHRSLNVDLNIALRLNALFSAS